MSHVRRSSYEVPGSFSLLEREIWPGCREIEVDGELDLAVSGELRSALERAAEDGFDVLIDFAACDFIDVSAVAVLVHGDAELERRGRRLLLSGVSGQVQRVLSVTGLAGANHGAPAPLRPQPPEQAWPPAQPPPVEVRLSATGVGGRS